METEEPRNSSQASAQIELLERFLGGIVLGRVPEAVAEAVDRLEESEIPEQLMGLTKMWQGRNRAPEAQADVIGLLQDTIKQMLP